MPFNLPGFVAGSKPADAASPPVTPFYATWKFWRAAIGVTSTIAMIACPFLPAPTKPVCAVVEAILARVDVDAIQKAVAPDVRVIP